MGSGIGDVTGAMGNLKDFFGKKVGTSKDANGKDVGGTSVGNLFASGIGGAMPKQPPQQQAAPAYNAPMLPFIPPPAPAAPYGGGMPPMNNAFYGG